MWKPILDAASCQAAAIHVEQIVRALRSSQERARERRSGLFSGWQGESLLAAYAEHAWGSQEVLCAQVESFLDAAIAALAAEPRNTGLCSGSSGIAWAALHLDHLAGTSFLDEDSFCEIDAQLSSAVADAADSRAADLIEGVVGIGVFALERLPSARAEQLLGAIIRKLDALAQTTPQGMTFFRDPASAGALERRRFPEGFAYTGVAHGVAGVMALCSAAAAAGIEAERSTRLVSEAYRWLQGCRLPDDHAATYSVHWSPTEPLQSNMNSWCHGDPGMSVALLAAARHIGAWDIESDTLQVARKAAIRRLELERSQCLCHGTAGMGHMYNRLYQATGEELFRRAAEYWFSELLAQLGKRPVNLLPPESGIDSLQAERQGFDPRGLLWGMAGVGLALIAATTDIEPAWDRVLLLSIPMSPLPQEGAGHGR